MKSPSDLFKTDDDGGIFEATGVTVVTFYASGEPVLTIRSDGSIEAGPGYTPTSAGTLAIDAMRTQLQRVLDQARAEEREACAAIADSWKLGDEESIIANSIAHDIRARDTSKS